MLHELLKKYLNFGFKLHVLLMYYNFSRVARNILVCNQWDRLYHLNILSNPFFESIWEILQKVQLHSKKCNIRLPYVKHALNVRYKHMLNAWIEHHTFNVCFLPYVIHAF